MSTSTVEIRSLEAHDAAIFQDLRLRALEDDPASFLASREEEAGVSLDDVRERLRANHGRVDEVVLGAFCEGSLVGMIGLYREKHMVLTLT